VHGGAGWYRVTRAGWCMVVHGGAGWYRVTGIDRC
jgi:hypothetical protein